MDETKGNIDILKTSIDRNNQLLSADVALLNMMGEDYKSKDLRQLDSLMAFTLVTPKLNIKNSVLNQATTNTDLIKSVAQDLKNSIYDIPVLVAAIINREKLIDQYVNDQLVPLMADEYSIRNMDAAFSPSMKHLGRSKFNKDSRKLLSIFKFENILDNKYFCLLYTSPSPRDS